MKRLKRKYEIKNGSESSFFRTVFCYLLSSIFKLDTPVTPILLHPCTKEERVQALKETLVFCKQPLLVIMYYLRARKEDKYLKNEFGDEYEIYHQKTSMFLPIRLNVFKREKRLTKPGVF